MIFTIKNEDLVKINDTIIPQFPKYTSQLINLANQNAQGTRHKVVGQLSELFPEYQTTANHITIDGWEKWYLERHPDALDNATNKIYNQIENLKKAIHLIDKNLIHQWVKDLVITKTYNGLYIQKAILAKLAEKYNQTYRLAIPEEESKGIDGYVGNTAYSIKPDTYKTMDRLSETINVKMIYYTKKKTGFNIEVEE